MRELRVGMQMSQKRSAIKGKKVKSARARVGKVESGDLCKKGLHRA